MRAVSAAEGSLISGCFGRQTKRTAVNAGPPKREDKEIYTKPLKEEY
jgi:hypothetical protein